MEAKDLRSCIHVCRDWRDMISQRFRPFFLTARDKLVFQFSIIPKLRYQFITGMTVDKDTENIFFCNWNPDRVLVFNIHGKYITKFGGGYLLLPESICISRSRVYILDAKGIKVFNLEDFHFIKFFKYRHGSIRSMTSFEDGVVLVNNDGDIDLLHEDGKTTQLYSNDFARDICINSLDQIVTITSGGMLTVNGDETRWVTLKPFGDRFNPKFDMDQHDNALVVDSNGTNVYLFSPKGEFIQQTDLGLGSLGGICLFHDKVIVWQHDKVSIFSY